MYILSSLIDKKRKGKKPSFLSGGFPVQMMFRYNKHATLTSRGCYFSSFFLVQHIFFFQNQMIMRIIFNRYVHRTMLPARSHFFILFLTPDAFARLWGPCNVRSEPVSPPQLTDYWDVPFSVDGTK
jgi:hypothetical protein